MLAICYEVKLRLYWSSGKEDESRCLVFTYSTILNVNLGAFSRRIRAVSDGREMYKKAWYTCWVVVLPIQPVFCRFRWCCRRRYLSSLLSTSLRALLIVHLFFFFFPTISLSQLLQVEDRRWKLMFYWNASKNRQYHEISNCLVCQILIFNKIITCTMEQGRCGGILLCWYFGRLRTQTFFRSSLLSSWWCFLTSLGPP